MSLKQLYDVIGKNRCIEFGIFKLNNVFNFEFNFNIQKLFLQKENVSLICDVIKSKLTNNNQFLENYDEIKHILNLNNNTIPLMWELSDKLNKNLITYDCNLEVVNDKYLNGTYDMGDSCIIICDVCMSGYDILKCINNIEKKGLIVENVVCLVDYKIGGLEAVRGTEVNIVSIYDIVKMSENFLSLKYLTPFDLNKIINCIDCSKKIMNSIKENTLKHIDEREPKLIQKTREELFHEKELELNNQIQIHLKSLKELTGLQNKVSEREQEIVEHENSLVEKSNQIHTLEEEFKSNMNIKHQNIEETEGGLCIRVIVSNVMGFVVGGVFGYIFLLKNIDFFMELDNDNNLLV